LGGKSYSFLSVLQRSDDLYHPTNIEIITRPIFHSIIMRAPAVAGKFYPRSGKQVRQEIERLFDSYVGGAPPLNPNGPREIKAMVVPHAGYTYSGPVAAHAYAALAKDGFPESFVVLGPNHNAFGSPVAMTDEDFETPLGRIDIDQDIAGKLGRLVADDPLAHRYEHSIEVQLPFIQFFNPNAKFVPIAMAAQDYDRTATACSRLGVYAPSAAARKPITPKNRSFLFLPVKISIRAAPFRKKISPKITILRRLKTCRLTCCARSPWSSPNQTGCWPHTCSPTWMKTVS
jgi:hypothetical protein